MGTGVLICKIRTPHTYLLRFLAGFNWAAHRKCFPRYLIRSKCLASDGFCHDTVIGPRSCRLQVVELGLRPRPVGSRSSTGPPPPPPAPSLSRKHPHVPMACLWLLSLSPLSSLLGLSEACRGPCSGQALDPLSQRHGGRECGEWTWRAPRCFLVGLVAGVRACSSERPLWTCSQDAQHLCPSLAFLIQKETPPQWHFPFPFQCLFSSQVFLFSLHVICERFSWACVNLNGVCQLKPFIGSFVWASP